MRFKIFSGLSVLFLVLFSCNKKCSEQPSAIKGVWTDNVTQYYFYDNDLYGYKFLRGDNVADTVSVADSAIGTYKVDQCQKVISLTQSGYYPRNNDSIYVPKNINFGTWKYTLQGDTLLEIETPTSFMHLRKIK